MPKAVTQFFFSLCVSVSCSEDHTGSQEGVLMSPDWPEPYPENSVCFYTLAVEEGLQFELTFVGVFDVEKENGQCIDSLTVCNIFNAIFEPIEFFLFVFPLVDISLSVFISSR